MSWMLLVRGAGQILFGVMAGEQAVPSMLMLNVHLQKDVTRVGNDAKVPQLFSEEFR